MFTATPGYAVLYFLAVEHCSRQSHKVRTILCDNDVQIQDLALNLRGF